MTAGKDAIDELTLERMGREFCRSALGGPDSEIAHIRERNLRAYNAEPVGEFAPPEIEDRSTFVDSSVADTVDGMIPQLIDVFVSDEKAVECKAKKRGPEAAQQAKHATGYLNHLFYTHNDGLLVLHHWMHDTATQKVGFTKIWAEDEPQDAEQTYEGQTEEQLASILVEGVELKGEPQVDEQGFLTFTTVDRSNRMRFKVEVVPPHEMRIDPNSKYGDDPAAIGQVCQKRRFELEEMGYDVEGIGGDNAGVSSEADALAFDAQGDVENELHDSHKLYEYAELYFQLDMDGDGTAEWVQVCLINGVLVHHEKVDDHPFATMCFMPRPHAFFGDCPADRAFGVQKEQTSLARSLFDNYRFSTDQTTYINTRANVNIGDLLDRRPGGIIRGEGPPSEAFSPIPTQAIPQTAWQMQEWLNVRLENRTGFTRYSQGMDADSLNKTATGVQIITSKSDMRLKLMMRFAALGLKQVFEKLLKLSSRHQDAEDWYEVNGEWIPVRPYEWRDQFTMKINVGPGHGTKQEQAQRVMSMMPLQQWGQQSGVVQPKHVANTIRLMAEVNEFKSAEEFCDPEPSGLPNPEQFQQMQQEMQESMQKAGEEVQKLEQENVQLKFDNESLKLDAKRKELQGFVDKVGSDLDSREQEVGRVAKETEQKQAEMADEDARLDAIEQTLGQVVQFLQQLAQQPQATEGMGMDAGVDAPAAPFEGM